MIKTQKEIEQIIFNKPSLSVLNDRDKLDIMRYNLKLLRESIIKEFLPKGAVCYCPYLRLLYIVHQPVMYKNCSRFYAKNWERGKEIIREKDTSTHNLLIQKEYAEKYG